MLPSILVPGYLALASILLNLVQAGPLKNNANNLKELIDRATIRLCQDGYSSTDNVECDDNCVGGVVPGSTTLVMEVSVPPVVRGRVRIAQRYPIPHLNLHRPKPRRKRRHPVLR